MIKRIELTRKISDILFDWFVHDYRICGEVASSILDEILSRLKEEGIPVDMEEHEIIGEQATKLVADSESGVGWLIFLEKEH